jgi:hypothetical protein
MSDINHLIVAAATAALALQSDSDSDSDSHSSDDSLEQDTSSNNEEREPKRRRGRTLNRETALNSSFNLRYLVPSLNDPDPNSPDSVWNDESALGRKFRTRFRLPFKMFDYFTKRYEKEYEVRAPTDATSKGVIGVPLLALGTLRILARDLTFDDLEDMNGISKETNRLFFHNFIGYLATLSNEFIHLPTTDVELKHVADFYRQLGLPGCAGSADCVHLFWDKCPTLLVSQCRGKEKFPSVVFQVVVSHTKRIMSISQIHMGCDNDKTIARHDSAISRIRSSTDIMKTSAFSYYRLDGTVGEAMGYYYIVDGGYHMWVELIAPFKHEPDGTIAELWSDTVESIRKDVECVFGMLKKRFMILKHPMRFPKQQTIEMVFLACSVLHNALCEYDSRDDWETRMEMRKLEDEESDVDGDSEEYRDRTLTCGRRKKPLDRVGLTRHMRRQLAIANAGDKRALGPDEEAADDDDDDVTISALEEYRQRRNLLVNHFTVASRKGEVIWFC